MSMNSLAMNAKDNSMCV